MDDSDDAVALVREPPSRVSIHPSRLYYSPNRNKKDFNDFFMRERQKQVSIMSPKEAKDYSTRRMEVQCKHEGIANENVLDVLLLQISFPSYSGLLKPRYDTAIYSFLVRQLNVTM